MSIKQIVIPSTGRTVSVRTPDNTKLLLKFQRQYPPPTPKPQEVNYGTPAKPVIKYEYNYADPSFRMAINAYEEYKSQWLNDKGLSLLVDCLVLDEQAKKDVVAWIEETGNPDGLSEQQIFFEEIALPEADDIVALVDALKPPAPQEVRAVADSFQS